MIDINSFLKLNFIQRNVISQEAHERMLNYYKSRMDDFRNENLSLRQRLKSNNLMQQQMISASRTNLNQDDYLGGGANSIGGGTSINGDYAAGVGNLDDDLCGGLLYTPSIDGDEHLMNKNEALQQRLNELEKLQMQLNTAQL